MGLPKLIKGRAQRPTQRKKGSSSCPVRTGSKGARRGHIGLIPHVQDTMPLLESPLHYHY